MKIFSGGDESDTFQLGNITFDKVMVTSLDLDLYGTLIGGWLFMDSVRDQVYRMYEAWRKNVTTNKRRVSD
jgi:hypothetical protein